MLYLPRTSCSEGIWTLKHHQIFLKDLLTPPTERKRSWKQDTFFFPRNSEFVWICSGRREDKVGRTHYRNWQHWTDGGGIANVHNSFSNSAHKKKPQKTQAGRVWGQSSTRLLTLKRSIHVWSHISNIQHLHILLCFVYLSALFKTNLLQSKAAVSKIHSEISKCLSGLGKEWACFISNC